MKTTIILLLFILIFGCKSNQKRIDDTKDLSEKTIEPFEVLSEKKLTLDSIFRIDNDSILIPKLIEFENQESFNEYGDNSDYISNGNAFYPTDTLFKVINLFGDVSGGATNNPYAINYIIRHKENINSKIEGEIFRIDKLKTNEYLFYVNDFWRLGSTINVYKTKFIGDSLITNKMDNKDFGNYYYDLINRKKEHPDSIKMRIDLEKWNDENTLRVLDINLKRNKFNKYYKLSDESFLKVSFYDLKGLEPIFYIYFIHSYGDQIEKVLRIKNKDQYTDFTLAMKGGDGQGTYSLSTEFLTDSTLIKIFKHKQTAVDNTHLMAYATDSIVTRYKYNKNFEFKEIKKDSFHIYKKYPTYYKNLKDKIFKTWSDVFTINGIKCNWEYEVKYTDETDENSKEPLVNLIGRKLLTWKTKKLLLDLDLSKFVYIPPKSISRLEYNKYPDSSIDNLKDVNSDSYVDFQFMTEHAGAGANIAYATYLFNAKKNKFEYSKVFSGYNIEYDSKKNRTSSFMKSGVDNYYYHFKNLKENRKDVEFIERLHHYVDTIFYEKIINQKIVKKKKVVLSEYEGWTKHLERN